MTNKVHSLIRTLSILESKFLHYFLDHVKAYFNDPPKNFQVIWSKKHSVKLQWDHEHYYYGYNLFWSVDNKSWEKIFINQQELLKTRIDSDKNLKSFEVFEFFYVRNHESVYYFQLSGWLYAAGDGNKTSVLKALKENIGIY